MNRLSNTLLVLFLFSVLLSAPVSAEPGWYYCDVDMAGSYSNWGVLIKLTHSSPTPAFEDKWFKADSKLSRELLALSMTAITNDKQVLIFADLQSNAYPTISVLYVVK